MKKHNIIKKFFSLALAGTLALSLCACGDGETQQSGNSGTSPSPSQSDSASASPSPSPSASDSTSPSDPASPSASAAPSETALPCAGYIGICNYVDDASLNQINESIQARLVEITRETGISFMVDYDNPNGDPTIMNQIIANFQADQVDLMVGIATPVAMAMQAATEDSDIPVVFSAVSDPVGAELVASLDAPGGNITGTSDYLDTNSIMNLIFAVNPDAKKIGLLYDVGQDSSKAPIAHAKEYLESKGIEVVERTGTNAAEVAQAAQALVADGVDAVFTPTDNTIMKAYLGIYEIFVDAGIPHYTGADSFALNGAFLGYGVDYANLGRETADMIAEILIDGKDPGTLAVKTFDNGTATINTETCAALGLDYDEIAELFLSQNLCTKVQPITTAEEFGDLEG